MEENNSPQMSDQNKPASSTPEKPATGYGQSYSKGGWKKWLLIYIIVAVVLYGLIYWWYRSAHKTTNTSGSTNTGSIY